MNFSSRNRLFTIITAALLLFYSGSLFSQSKSEIKFRKIKSIITSISDIRKGDTTLKKNFSKYDRAGNLIESIDYDLQGNMKDHEQFQYNRRGDEVMYTQLNSGQVIKRIESHYNKWHNLTGKTIYDADGNISEKIEITYNPFNDPVKEITMESSGKIIRSILYSYDNKGMLTSKKLYNEKGMLIYSKEYSIQY